jgi:hypothetical protein
VAVRSAARPRERGTAAPYVEPVSRRPARGRAGVQQQLEVADDLPDDEQRLLATVRRPQLGGDLVRGARPVARIARIRSQRAVVVAQARVDERAWSVTGAPWPVSSRSSGIAAVRRRLSR